MNPVHFHVQGRDFMLPRSNPTLRVRTQRALDTVMAKIRNKGEIDKVTRQKRTKQRYEGVDQEKRAHSVDPVPVKPPKKKVAIATELEESCMAPILLCAPEDLIMVEKTPNVDSGDISMGKEIRSPKDSFKTGSLAVVEA